MLTDQGKLLRGDNININNVGNLKSITVNDIIDSTEKKYYEYLNLLTFDIENNKLSNEDRQRLSENNIKSTFDFIRFLCFSNIDCLKIIIQGLKFFFKDDVCFFKEAGIFFLGDFEEYRFITSENYEEIKFYLKIQNGLLKDDILDENPKDERTRILLEKRRKIREKLDKAKSKENGENIEPLTFGDLISIMCSKANGVNHENIWNMNIYLFQNQFQRMKMINDFDISIRSLLAGSKSDDIDLKHYISHL